MAQTGKTTRAPSRESPRDQDAPKFVETEIVEPEAEPKSEAPKFVETEIVKPEAESEPEPGSGSVSLQTGASLLMALLVNIAAAFWDDKKSLFDW